VRFSLAAMSQRFLEGRLRQSASRSSRVVRTTGRPRGVVDGRVLLAHRLRVVVVVAGFATKDG
jgi:hypothetical protein